MTCQAASGPCQGCGLWQIMKKLNGLILMLSILALANSLRAQSVGNNISNVSARIDLAPNGSYVFGFVVPPLGWTSNLPGTGDVAILLRAVGPSLKAFGITNPAPSPTMKLYNSNGQLMTFVLFPTELAIDWARVMASVGAFPLTGGEQLGTAFNAANFPPGNYTVTISDSSGHGGTVLFELYILGGNFPGTVVPPGTAIVVSSKLSRHSS